MKIDLDSLTKRFIINEGVGPTLESLVQVLHESINGLKPRTRQEEKRYEVMRHQIKEIRRSARRMTERNNLLEEENRTLQENSEK